MNPLRRQLRAQLDDLASQGLRRHLPRARGIDFCSNDYLGLGTDAGFGRRLSLALEEHLRQGGVVGSPASRLLWNDPGHGRLERRLARFKGTERSLLFASGYQANLALLGTLVEPGDRVLSDRLNHASLIDGMRLAGCHKEIFPHLDVQALERALRCPFAGRTFVVTESLFSMDGDIAPLDIYAGLAERYGAYLIVDDAHATGVFGPRGAGLTEHFAITSSVTAVTTTFGKALGLSGACVSGPEEVIDMLIHRGRPFLFSTAPPPLLVLAIETALDVVAEEPARRRRVLQAAERLRCRLATEGLGRPEGSGPIVPIPLGDNHRALAAAGALRDQGFEVRAIRPPTVPPGTARLRISFHAHHTDEQIDRLAESLARILETETAVSLAGGPT